MMSGNLDPQVLVISREPPVQRRLGPTMTQLGMYGRLAVHCAPAALGAECCHCGELAWREYKVRKKLKFFVVLPLAAALVGLGAGPSAAAPNDDKASCVAQTGHALGPPGQNGEPIGGQMVSLLAHLPRNLCPGADIPVPS